MTTSRQTLPSRNVQGRKAHTHISHPGASPLSSQHKLEPVTHRGGRRLVELPAGRSTGCLAQGHVRTSTPQMLPPHQGSCGHAGGRAGEAGSHALPSESLPGLVDVTAARWLALTFHITYPFLWH